MSDLVRDSRLRTIFPPDARQGEVPTLTAHVFEESGHHLQERLIERKEVWKRERFVARGAYGSVWLERCVKGSRVDETRAVKQIMRSPQQASGSKNVLDYDRELESFAKLSHQNYNRCFVQSFGWYEWENALLIAMEYLPLGDLQDHLSESSQLFEPEGQQVTSQLLEGLSFMHQNGYMHRDLKPKNILIKSKPPQPWWVKIGDFGISRRADTEFSATTAIQGTLGFLAPELHGLVGLSSDRGRHILGASDMWALGETVFRLLTNAVSFPTLRDLISYARGETPFPTKPLLDCGISEAGVSFVCELLIVDPGKRATGDSGQEHDWIVSQRASRDGSRPPSFLFSGLAIDDVETDDLSEDTSASLFEASAAWTTLESTQKASQDMKITLPTAAKRGTKPPEEQPETFGWNGAFNSDPFEAAKRSEISEKLVSESTTNQKERNHYARAVHTSDTMSAEYINLGSVSSHSTKTRISDPQDPPSLYDGLPVLPPRSSSGNLQTHTNHDKEELSLPTYENQPAIVGTIFTDQSSVLRHPLPTQPNSIDALRSGFAAATRNHGLNRNASHEVPKPIATAHYERPAESYTPAGLPNTGSITSGEYTSEPAVSAGVAAVDRVDAFADGAPFLAPNTYSKTLGNGGEGGQHSAQIARIPFSRPDAALEIFTPLTPWLYTSKGGQIKTKYESGYDPGVGTVGLLWSRQAGKLYLPVQNRLISRIWDFVDPPHSRSAAVSPDGVWVLSVDDNRAFMQEGKTRVPLYSMTRLDAEEYGVTTPVFSPDSQNYILASGTQCSLHHAKSGSPKFWLRPQPKHCFTSFAFSPNSERFVSGSDDGVIRLWSSETGGLLYQLSPRGLCGRDHPSVAYSPLGRTFASLGLYGSPGVGGSVLRLFDTLTGQETTNVTIKSSGVPNSVSFSPDGRQVAVLGWTGIVRLDIDSGKRLSHLGGAPSHDPYTASAFSPDGTILVTCNSALQIWDTKTNQLRMVQYEGHNFPDLISGGRPLSVNTITFSPNSAKVATTAKVSQYVRLFDVT